MHKQAGVGNQEGCMVYRSSSEEESGSVCPNASLSSPLTSIV